MFGSLQTQTLRMATWVYELAATWR